MPITGTKLGIIAGGGDLPLAIAESALHDGREVFIVAIDGLAIQAGVERFPHAWASLGEIGKVIRLLKDARCFEVTMAGRVPRPQFNTLKLDAKGAMALPGLIGAAVKGDDALLRAIVGLLEKEGFGVIGSDVAARGLLAPLGPLGNFEPNLRDDRDIVRAVEAVRMLGALDIGQAAVVCEGLVLAVEAAEGTDQMLMRVANLPEAIRGTPVDRRGVLVKAVKPKQERRVDLPVIGMETVRLASAAGLAGIAVEAGSALILNRAAVADNADMHGIFVFGYSNEVFGDL